MLVYVLVVLVYLLVMLVVLIDCGWLVSGTGCWCWLSTRHVGACSGFNYTEVGRGWWFRLR